MNVHLSEKAQQLIPKARIVSFAGWRSLYPSEIVQLFQTADDESRYLTDADLQQIEAHSSALSTSITAVKFLRDSAGEIIAEARERLLAQYPDIAQPGGDLHPPGRAEACWRDFWHFLRCITYGIAGGSTEFTSSEGLQYMQLLYEELRVPLNAMVSGLENLKAASLKRLPAQEQALAPYFDCLITQMSRFRSS